MVFPTPEVVSPITRTLSLLPQINLVEDMTDDGRYYINDTGIRVPSVTTVLSRIPKPGIDSWKKRIGAIAAAQVLKNANTQGTGVHDLCERYIKYGKATLAKNPLINCLFLQIKTELDTHVGTVIGIECPLFSESLNTAGRTDLIAEWGSELVIVDYKTSKTKKPDKYMDGYFMQSTCYALMANAQYNLNIKKFVLIISCDDSLAAQVVVRDIAEFSQQTIDFFSAAR